MNTPLLVPISSVIVTLLSSRPALPSRRRDELSPLAARSTISPTIHYPPARAACQAGGQAPAWRCDQGQARVIRGTPRRDSQDVLAPGRVAPPPDGRPRPVPATRDAFSRSRAWFGAGSNWSGAGVYGIFTPAARTASGPPCSMIRACWLAFARASVASGSQIARSCASQSASTGGEARVLRRDRGSRTRSASMSNSCGGMSM